MSKRELVVRDVLVYIDAWEKLAAEAEERGRWDTKMGISDGEVQRNQALSYRQTAEAMRRELETGKPCCSNCGGAHDNTAHAPERVRSRGVPAPCACKKAGCPWCFLSRH